MITNELPLTIVGNLTTAPELRFTPAGVAVARFAIAFNPRRPDRDNPGKWIDGEPTFLDCAAWRTLAENIAESLELGHRVIASGSLRTERWESNGQGSTPAGTKLSRLVLDVVAIGPDLTFATAAVKKATRTRAGEVAPDDPWATATRTRPTAPAAPGSFDDEPPFS